MILSEARHYSLPLSTEVFALFVSSVFPHFGVQSIHSQIDPMGVNELNAGKMRTSKGRSWPTHDIERGAKLGLTSVDVRESSSCFQP